jgi:hypothetical protein
MSGSGYEITFHEKNENIKSLEKEKDKEKIDLHNDNENTNININNALIKTFKEINYDIENLEHNSYNSDDDLENYQLIHIVSKSNNSDYQQNSIQIIDQEINAKEKKINLIDKKELFQNIIYFRIVNSISIIILICSFIFISFKILNKSNNISKLEDLKYINIQSEYYSLVLNIGGCILISKNKNKKT